MQTYTMYGEWDHIVQCLLWKLLELEKCSFCHLKEKFLNASFMPSVTCSLTCTYGHGHVPKWGTSESPKQGGSYSKNGIQLFEVCVCITNSRNKIRNKGLKEVQNYFCWHHVQRGERVPSKVLPDHSKVSFLHVHLVASNT